MLNKIDLFVLAFCVVGITTAIFLVQHRLSGIGQGEVQNTQTAQAPAAKLIMVNEDTGLAPTSTQNKIKNKDTSTRMVINDIKVGGGEEAKVGDMVVVHYSGTFQDGTEFDNSRKRGEGFQFTLGAGMVIKGWDEGVVGMKEGGERVLVIPPEKAYGEQGIGPIPGGATLVFTIQLLEVK